MRSGTAALRQALRSGRVPTVEDTVPPQPRSTRDALVGRRRYEPREPGRFWTTLPVRTMPVNAAAHRGRVRTDDVLPGMLRKRRPTATAAGSSPRPERTTNGCAR